MITRALLGLMVLSLPARTQPDPFMRTFTVDKSALRSTGHSPWFSLDPGTVREYDGEGTHLVITVTARTRMVDGVETRVVEERETNNGKLVEVSRNYFAIEPKSGDVYYFGEDVDMYRNGRVINHEGSWLAGVGGAKFGMMMAGNPVVGSRHYQEVAPRKAMDRAEVVSTTETVVTPAGTFRNCVKIEETTPLEPGVKEYKYYAPGAGLVQDGELKLVKQGTK
jgi:hypothetical protein